MFTFDDEEMEIQRIYEWRLNAMQIKFENIF